MVDGLEIRRDEAGYLIDPDTWNDAVADMLAAEEGIALDPEHRDILEFIRKYYAGHMVIPDARFAFRFLGQRNATDAKAARTRFFQLFPYGYVKQACKIAGMRQPRAWSTG